MLRVFYFWCSQIMENNMKLVLEIICDMTGKVSYITFDCESKQKAIETLNETIEHNRVAYDSYWKEDSDYTFRLEQYIKNKDYNKLIDPPERPVMDIQKFCGLEVLKSDGYVYEILTLDEFVEQHYKEIGSI